MKRNNPHPPAEDDVRDQKKKDKKEQDKRCATWLEMPWRKQKHKEKPGEGGSQAALKRSWEGEKIGLLGTTG
jgi:hypothetical protein